MSTIRGVTYKNVFELVSDFETRYRLFYSLFITRDIDLMNFIKNEDKEKYNRILELPINNDNADLYLFKVAAILSPHSDIYYHGYHFTSYEDIGKKIIKFAPKIDVYLLDLLKEGLILDHMKRQGIDKTNPTVFNKVDELTKFSSVQKNIAYFRFGFYFNGVENIKIDGSTYSNYASYLSTLHEKDLTDLADTFEENGFLIAWQISSAKGDLSIYRRFRHTLRIYNEKKVVYEAESKISNKKD